MVVATGSASRPALARPGPPRPGAKTEIDPSYDTRRTIRGLVVLSRPSLPRRLGPRTISLKSSDRSNFFQTAVTLKRRGIRRIRSEKKSLDRREICQVVFSLFVVSLSVQL